MRLVTIRKEHLKRFTADKEMLQKSNRPCVLVMRLKYKGSNHSFAVPIRSNIPPASPKDEYFPLPTRYTTKDGHRHGLHYIKMFPVVKGMYDKFHSENNLSASIMKAFIDNNEKEIILQCQAYLERYQSGNIPKYATNIDLLLRLIDTFH